MDELTFAVAQQQIVDRTRHTQHHVTPLGSKGRPARRRTASQLRRLAEFLDDQA